MTIAEAEAAKREGPAATPDPEQAVPAPTDLPTPRLMAAQEFGAWLALARKQRGISQAGLARAIGLHTRTISKIECGDYEPPAATQLLLRLMLRLGSAEIERLLAQKVSSLRP